MAFRYINPGYGALTGDSSVETFENTTYNPSNGVAFQKYDSSLTTIKIPMPQAFTTDIYGKFDLYFDSNSNSLFNFSVGAFSTSNSFASDIYYRCIGVRIEESKVRLSDGRYYDSSNRVSLKSFALNSIWFHWHFEEVISNSYGEMIVNDSDKITTSPQHSQFTFSSEKSFFITIPTAGNCGDKVFISNVIVSDEYISPKEKIIAIPTSQTITDMTAGASGIYIADAADQQLLQSVDVVKLIQDYGADSAITGIALAGNPAYRTAEGLAKLTALSKSGGVITEHDTIALSGDSSAAIMDGWGLSGVTIVDLQNMQFGWKVGA